MRPLCDGTYVRLIAKETLNIVRVLIRSNFVVNSAENQDLFVRFVICDNGHALIANEVNLFAGNCVLHVEPELLVKQEQVDVVEERSSILLAHLVVSSTDNDQAAVCGQVFHRVTEASNWRRTAHLESCKLSVHHFLVNSVRFEQF